MQHSTTHRPEELSHSTRPATRRAGGWGKLAALAWLWFAHPWEGFAQSLTVPNGNLESPVVAAWSTALPASWTWAAGPGSGSAGLTGTGGANGSQQTLYGNQIAGTLTSGVLPQTVTSAGRYALRYWVKRENSGPFTLTAKLVLSGGELVSHADVIATNSWTQYTLSFNVPVADVGKTMQIQFIFSNGSGAWQGYLDEITLDALPPAVSLPSVAPAVYPYYLDPATYPDYTRRPLKVADWSVYGNRPQFVGVRGGTMDEAYFTSRWKPYQFTVAPTNSGLATLKIENVNCDGTVLVDNVDCQQTSGSPEWLQNSDFEGSAGWTLGAGTVYTTTQSHSPTHSILVAANSSLDAWPRPTTVQTGHTYLCRVWARTAGTGSWVIVFGNWQAGGAHLWVNRPTVNSAWEQFSFLATPTALTDGYNQFSVISQPGGPSIYVDDFSVQEAVTSGTNWLANPGFETPDPGQDWVRTAGVNVYPDGYNSRHSMLVRAGHSLQTTLNLQAGQRYTTTVWLSIAGRSQGQVQVSLGGPNVGAATLAVAEETTRNPSGLVYWPNVNTLVNGLSSSELNAMTSHGVILHNPAGYGPGDAWTGSYGQALASSNALAAITNKLGSQYTGADIGEQDARFANVFEGVHEPFSLRNRFANYRTTHRYLGQVGDDLGNIMSLLDNLWFWHYPVKGANVLVVGAQTQPKEGIANAQVHYSFLRGAGKQYGVPWFGNASVFSTDWDREGPQTNYKTYPSQATNGNSLNLMRRLMFTHYLYGCNSLSFEGSWRTDQNSVSPIGMVQEAMVQTVSQYGRPGVMHTPVALLLDFYSGWMPAQYNRGNYYVWNAIDYGVGDHLTHNVFSLLYPSYEANGFFQNELGGLSDTPYGDIADTLLSDVTAPVLNRYGVVVAAGNLPSADTELRDKVEAFLAGGGNFIVTGENARRLWPEFGIGPGQIAIAANGVVSWVDSATSTESNSGKLYSVNPGLLPAGYKVLASFGGLPAVIDIPRGGGRITLLLSPFGLNDSPLTSLHPPYAWGYNTALPKPYVLMSHVRRLLDNRLASQRLFDVGNSRLGYVTCRQGQGQYLVGLHNNSLTSQSFSITSLVGPLTNFTELDLGRAVTNELGYWPLGYANNNGGLSNGSNIFGGDIRLFRLWVAETNTVRVLGSNLPPARPLNRMVTVPALCNLKDTLLGGFTFFEHFDGVKLDWASVRSADLGFLNGATSQLREPINWLKRQQVRCVADFSSGFVTGALTLQTNASGTNYQQSLGEFSRVMDKLTVLGRANDVIITAEDIPGGQTEAVKAGISTLCASAQSRGITVHFKHRTTRWTPDVTATLNFVSSVGAANLKFAANTADAPGNIEGLLEQAAGRLGLILISPPANGAPMELSPVRSRNAIQILDAQYVSWDSIYRDLRAAWISASATALTGVPISLPLETYWTTHSNNAARFYGVPDTADLPGTLRTQTNFWSCFGGVKVDYKYLAYRDPAQCVREAHWLAARKVQLVVDFSSDLNNYPGLTLTDSSTPGDGLSANYYRSAAIIDDVFDKMQLMGVTNCIFRPTTTNTAAYTDLFQRAWARGQIRVHLQHYMANWMTSYQSPRNVAALIAAAAPANGNLQMAVNGNHEADMAGLLSTAGTRLGLILLGYPGSSRADVHAQTRLGSSKSALVGRTEPQILDSEYVDWNDIALDLAYLGWTAVNPPVIPYHQITTNRPVFGAAVGTDGNIVFDGSGGAPGATFCVLSNTNLTVHSSSWTPWRTNQFDVIGRFSFTNGPGSVPRFYRLRMY
jgi:hypothetical protein